KASALVESSPSVSRYQRTLAYAYEGLGAVHRDVGHLDQAEKAYEHQRDAITDAIEWFKDFDLQQSLAGVHERLGSLRREQRRFKEAVAAYTQGVSVRRELRRVTQDLVREGKKKQSELQGEEKKLASSLGNLAFTELFNGRPDLTVQYSLEAQRLDPDAVWIK